MTTVYSNRFGFVPEPKNAQKDRGESRALNGGPPRVWGPSNSERPKKSFPFLIGTLIDLFLSPLESRPHPPFYQMNPLIYPSL